MDNNIYSDKDKELVLARYKARIAEFGVGLDSLKSGSHEKQIARHTAHASVLKTERPSILDIGCGLGHFSDYLTSAGIEHEYYGYDIVPEYIDYCNSRFTKGNFKLHNIFEEGINGKFDYIILSQVLNNRFKFSNNNDVMKACIKMTHDHSNYGVSIDMMSEFVDFQNEELFYFSPAEIFNYAKSVCPRVLLKHDYRAYEFCIQLFKPAAPGFTQ